METTMRKLLTFLIALGAIVFAVGSPVSAQMMTTGVGSIVHFVPGSSYIGPGNIAFNGSSANVKAYYSCARPQ
jgi:hypothetical protein